VNNTGVSWDHLYPIHMGYKKNIPIDIMTHPANAELVPHKENYRRYIQCKAMITLEELYERFELWNNVVNVIVEMYGMGKNYHYKLTILTVIQIIIFQAIYVCCVLIVTHRPKHSQQGIKRIPREIVIFRNIKRKINKQKSVQVNLHAFW